MITVEECIERIDEIVRENPDVTNPRNLEMRRMDIDTTSTINEYTDGTCAYQKSEPIQTPNGAWEHTRCVMGELLYNWGFALPDITETENINNLIVNRCYPIDDNQSVLSAIQRRFDDAGYGPRTWQEAWLVCQNEISKVREVLGIDPTGVPEVDGAGPVPSEVPHFHVIDVTKATSPDFPVSPEGDATPKF